MDETFGCFQLNRCAGVTAVNKMGRRSLVSRTRDRNNGMTLEGGTQPVHGSGYGKIAEADEFFSGSWA